MSKKNNEIESSLHRQRDRQYRRIYVPCFIVFLIASLIGRIMPWNWRIGQTAASSRKTIIEEAKELAGTCVPYLFANY